MKNYVTGGDLIDVIVSKPVVSGAGVLVGSVFGVASTSRKVGGVDVASLRTDGVYRLAKVPGMAWRAGDPVYWDINMNAATNRGGVQHKLIGSATAAAASGDLVGVVRLRGSTAAPSSVYDARAVKPVCSRNIMAMNGLSSGTNQFTTYRAAHFALATTAIGGLRLVYTNALLTTTGETDGQDDYTVKASIEYNGVCVPVYFSGLRTATVKLGAQVVSDPVGISIPAGAQFWTRSFVGVDTAGKKWPVGPTANSAHGLGEGFHGTNDRTDEPTFTTFGNASLFQPTAIIGTTAAAVPSFVMIGSSSGYGQGDTSEAPMHDYGYLSRFLSNRYGYVKLTRASDALSFFLADHKRRLALIAASGATHVIQQLGSNDLANGGTYEQVYDRLNRTWDILASTGAKVVQCTMTPVATSTDQWATPGNQTPHSSNAVRTRINDYIRSMPAPLAGVLECADIVETSRNSGIWKSDGTPQKWTVDGTHLTQFGHQQVAAQLRDEDLSI